MNDTTHQDNDDDDDDEGDGESEEKEKMRKIQSGKKKETKEQFTNGRGSIKHTENCGKE